MKPLILRMVPKGVCVRCARGGYVHKFTRLCCFCLGLALGFYEREKEREERYGPKVPAGTKI